MGDHCNAAFYEAGQNDLLRYQFLLYKRRGGDLWEVGPRLALLILEIHEMLYTRQLTYDSPEEILAHQIEKLKQFDFYEPRLISEHIFEGGEEVDYFYAVHSNFYDVAAIDVYTPAVEDWECPLPNRTRRFHQLRSASAGAKNPETANFTFGLKKLKSIELFETLKLLPR